MKRGMQWPIGVAMILAVTVIGDVWIAVIASRDEAFAVEPDYYRKAVNFDEEMALRDASLKLGWIVDPTLALGTPDSVGSISAIVRDSSGVLVTGARVELVAMHNARASRQLEVTLAEDSGGRYRAPLDAQRPGEWELRFLVSRGADRFAVRTRVDGAPPR